MIGHGGLHTFTSRARDVAPSTRQPGLLTPPDLQKKLDDADKKANRGKYAKGLCMLSTEGKKAVWAEGPMQDTALKFGVNFATRLKCQSKHLSLPEL